MFEKELEERLNNEVFTILRSIQYVAICHDPDKLKMFNNLNEKTNKLNISDLNDL